MRNGAGLEFPARMLERGDAQPCATGLLDAVEALPHHPLGEQLDGVDVRMAYDESARHVRRLQRRVQALETSYSLRLGAAMTWPVRSLLSWLRRAGIT